MFSVTFGLRIGRPTSHDLVSCPAQLLTIPSVAAATEGGDPAGAGEPGEGVGEVMTVRNDTGHHTSLLSPWIGEALTRVLEGFLAVARQLGGSACASAPRRQSPAKWSP